MKRAATAMLAIVVSVVCGCRREAQKERGDAPPPPPSAVAGLCSGGGGKITDGIAAKLLPTTVLGYCVDPHNEIRTYGKDGKGSIEQVCTELFDGECEVYRNYALERVVSARYADGAGTPGNVTVNLSRFDTSQNAFGFFTKRVVGDADPATLTTEQFDAGTMAALGSGVAYLFRGVHVAELNYSNDNEDPKTLKESAKRILPALAKAIGELLPGERELPAAARLLPEAGRFKLGVLFEPKDALGVTGAGPGAIGFYRDGERRYRILALERPNEQAAQDVIKTIRRATGASEPKGPKATGTLELRLDAEGTKFEWVLARTGRAIVGVGDDDHVPTDASKKAERLPMADKAARLQELVSDVAKRLPAHDGP
jgi:hypothetical protein